MTRSTDLGQKHYFRAERMFLSNEQYYFSTREGVEQGPYANPNDAEKALGRYVRTQHTMQRLQRGSSLENDQIFNQQGVARASNEIRSWRRDRAQTDD